MNISFIQPSRNNLKYLKWSYESIRKNQGEHEVEICVYDDASTDGTEDWLTETSKTDPNLKWYRNNTGKRVGHTIGYDYLVNEVATNELCIIFHADMYLCPGALDAIEEQMCPLMVPTHKHMTGAELSANRITRDINEKTICSLTRIEPPLHPPGPEKILKDYGVEPEEFKEQELLEWVTNTGFGEYYGGKTTEGIFAPWAFWKKDFQEIGGHDKLFAPQSKEDSDIFNRFQLNGVKFVQTWEGCVYHMTCRGSRRNTVDKAKNIYEDSPEWLAQNMRSTRNFIRKWGHFVKHDSYMKPIVPNKYKVLFKLTNSNMTLLKALEPWCDSILVDKESLIQDYISEEQPNTDYSLQDRVGNLEWNVNTDIEIQIDGNMFNNDDFNMIQQLSEILDHDEQLEPGEFMLGSMKVTINRVKTYTNDLIRIETPYNTKVVQ